MTTPGHMPEDPTIRLGISACLLGENVRANGGHSRDAFLAKTLGRWVDWVHVQTYLNPYPRELMLRGHV